MAKRNFPAPTNKSCRRINAGTSTTITTTVQISFPIPLPVWLLRNPRRKKKGGNDAARKAKGRTAVTKVTVTNGDIVAIARARRRRNDTRKAAKANERKIGRDAKITTKIPRMIVEVMMRVTATTLIVVIATSERNERGGEKKMLAKGRNQERIQ